MVHSQRNDQNNDEEELQQTEDESTNTNRSINIETQGGI